MSKILKSCVIFFLALFLNASIFALNVNFTDPTTTPGGTPDLSTTSGADPQVTPNNSGRYVYAIWNFAPAIQVAISSDFGVTWTDPTTTPAGTPDLATSGSSAQITTDSSGRYVYAIWHKGIDIQVAISSDFGVTWTDPITTPAGTPDLSANGQDPQITIDSTGRYVYAIWNVPAGGAVQLAISSDFGRTWTSRPDLAAAGSNTQIITDNTGKYVYAVWDDFLGTGVVQVSISSDFGVTWTSRPDLAAAGVAPQITTDSTGRYVYAVWYDSGTGKVQVSISSDFGVTWTSRPDLVSSGSQFPQITTDSTGRYVYAIWGGTVQVAISSDFGVTWINPTTTPAGTPDLAASSGTNAHIKTDSSGRYIYAIWRLNTGKIQVAISTDFGLNWTNPITTPAGTPDLVASGLVPQIITDSTGRHVYPVWSSGRIQTANGFKTFFPIQNINIQN
ncbi:MAG: hypothetical protein KR126chlam6_01029 [Candidatus Anoxychlamydiales bacterium]|nr:hypothetical protein [Candidatus Anoxychlamydiales bacterium]